MGSNPSCAFGSCVTLGEFLDVSENMDYVKDPAQLPAFLSFSTSQLSFVPFFLPPSHTYDSTASEARLPGIARV